MRRMIPVFDLPTKNDGTDVARLERAETNVATSKLSCRNPCSQRINPNSDWLSNERLESRRESQETELGARLGSVRLGSASQGHRWHSRPAVFRVSNFKSRLPMEQK